jgi:hypothetical protein
VRRDDDLGAVVRQVLERVHGRADARVVRDVELLVEGDVEVAAHEHALALEVGLLKVADRALGGVDADGGGARRAARGDEGLAAAGHAEGGGRGGGAEGHFCCLFVVFEEGRVFGGECVWERWREEGSGREAES